MAITERLGELREARAWEGEIPTRYRYTMGLAGERFFREIKERGQLLGTRCPSCGCIYVPPRLYCEQCFEKLDEWLEVGPQGTVHSFTVLHLGLDGSALEQPKIIAFVQLDDADGGLVHYLGEIEPEEVYIGLPVEAVFKPKAERVGSILDIQYFRPVA
ncbi:MAG: Zn-ribbon domain-containing OB-fold protein [Chloroflexi bacterium]|nr:Zn-ribbon domain-containing OB-fold protein [Chloroflexota bacterium]